VDAISRRADRTRSLAAISQKREFSKCPAGHFRPFRFRNAQNYRLETNCQFVKAQHWWAFLQVFNKNRIKPYCPIDILQRLLAEIVENKRRLASHLPEGIVRKVDATQLAFIFDTRRHINSIAINVVIVDNNVANIGSDPKHDPLRRSAIAFRHLALQVRRASYCIDGASEFHQHAIACRLDDSAVMLGNYGIDNLVTERF
jgi:hypothetical protein